MRQPSLFRLPAAAAIRLTMSQREALDWIAFNEGRVARFTGSRPALRALLDKKLIKIIALSPARYMLTGVGRVARSAPFSRYERQLPPTNGSLPAAED